MTEDATDAMVGGDMAALRWGQPAPGFSLPSTLGRAVALEDHRGQDVILAFYCYDWGNI